MLTEKEARGRWCPMGRFPTWFDPDGNQTEGMSNQNSYCRASDCMMWQWEPQDLWVHRIKNAQDETPSVPVQEIADMLPRRGYCGLAGKEK